MTYIKKIKELSQIKSEMDFSDYIYDNFCSMELSIWKDICNNLKELSFTQRAALFVSILLSMSNKTNRRIFIKQRHGRQGPEKTGLAGG